ncbi:hypothetical protein H8E88_12000 [candidate division KSB1 bacterium]|nr:hypothetical protein [candidate division KSB1 bacterium]MBL7095710.1 hypothetical protein [candidate division KSB1 bacterium]
MFYIKILLAIFIFVFQQSIFSQTVLPKKNDFVIIPPKESQSFMFTNMAGMYYYGETGSRNTSPFHGLSFLTTKIVEDYLIEAGGQVLKRSDAEVHLYKNKLIRHHNSIELIEETTISDSIPVLIIKLSSKQQIPISVFPLIAKSGGSQNYSKTWSPPENTLYISRRKQLVENNTQNNGKWIGISTFPAGNFSNEIIEEINYQNRSTKTKIFLPGKINFYLEGSGYIFFFIADSKKDILNYRKQILKDLNLKINKKEIPIEGIRKA